MRHVSKFFCALLFWNASVYGGAGSHGGCDVHGPDDAAWFPKSGTSVPYCIDVSEQFDRTFEDLKALTALALEQWTKYTIEKIPNPHLATQFHWVSCTNSHQLRFLFGGKSDATEMGLPRAIGIARAPREKVPGVIWIRDPGSVGYHLRGGKPVELNVSWKQDSILLSVLMHEIGHAFGNPHIDGTIMAEDIIIRSFAQQLSKQKCGPVFEKVPTIDQERDLVPCVRCALEGGTQSWAGTLTAMGTRYLMGLDVWLPKENRYSARINAVWSKGQVPKTEITIQFNNKQYRISLCATQHEFGTVFPGQSVFRTFPLTTNLSDRATNLHMSSGGVRTLSARGLPVRLEYNTRYAVELVFNFTPAIGYGKEMFRSHDPYACYSDLWPASTAHLGVPLPVN